MRRVTPVADDGEGLQGCSGNHSRQPTLGAGHNGGQWFPSHVIGRIGTMCPLSEGKSPGANGRPPFRVPGPSTQNRLRRSPGTAGTPRRGLAIARPVVHSGHCPPRRSTRCLPCAPAGLRTSRPAARRCRPSMYLGPTWPLAGGMAAARAGTSGGRGVLTAAIGAAVVPLGFVLGREIQRRVGRGGRAVPAHLPGPGRPDAPIRTRPAPSVPARAAGVRRHKGSRPGEKRPAQDR